jgi:DNA-binding protein YbaB
MTTETNPQVAEALQQMQRFISALEDDKYRANTESFTATDDAETVKVTVNGDRWLTGLRIEHGLLRLGAETVRQRIHEALHKAQAAASAATEDQEQQLEETLTGLLGAIQQQFGDLPTPSE